MKIAIIHDHYLYLGGAERVLLVLLKIYPQADVYTAFITNQNLLHLQKLTSGRIHISPFNRFPFAHKYADWYKPLTHFYWESLDLTQYDLVISSSHSFSSKSVITQTKTLHLAYIHTPPRYLFPEFNETQIINKQPFKLLLSPIMSWLRMKDFLGAQYPDVLIANAKTVQKRIKKYYRRDSIVIYPPVKIPQKLPRKGKGEYFLVVSRLVKQKGVDLAIKAYNQLNEQLVIVGTGREEMYLKSISGPTIHFKGFVSDEQMPEIFTKAKALIYCSRDEDFGIVPVEAMAYGIPVIAYKSGGVKESVINGKTGILFDKFTTSSLTQAISKFQSINLSSKECQLRAKLFSNQTFKQQITTLIVNKTEKSR